VLEKMEDDTWEKALLELEIILWGDHSEKTDSVAALLKKKGCIDLKYIKGIHTLSPNSFMGFEVKEYNTRIHVKHLSEHPPAIIRNICIYILSHDKDGDMRAVAAITLGEIGDPQALNLLVKAMENDTDGNVRIYSIRALANFYSLTTVKKMIEMFAEEDKIITCILLGTGKHYSLKGGGGGVKYYHSYIDETAKAIAETLKKIMPPSFPLGDYRGLISESKRSHNPKNRVSKRKKRTEIMLDWFNKNRHRLEWDAEKRRYYLKPE
jgi:hypothetical protein